jgi:N-acetylglutamate synthase-like GNAT family acetyltransferase
MNEIPKPTAAPSVAEPTATATVEPTPEAAVVEIRRAKRGDLSQMADIIAAATQKEMMLEEGDMMERLFSKGYLVAQQQDEIVGLIGWQTENLIAGIDDFFLKDSALWQSVGDELIRQVEKAVSELSCEVGLIFLHNKTGPSARSFLENHGYKEKKAEELDKMWREAAQEWAVDNTTLMVKPLLERRIMTPI